MTGGPKDLTEALKSHRLRCEIERAFFFHVFYELLRERFGDHSFSANLEELQLFDKLGSEVSLTTSLESISADLRTTLDARREFDTLSNRDKILKRREEQSIIYKPNNNN